MAAARMVWRALLAAPVLRTVHKNVASMCGLAGKFPQPAFSHNDHSTRHSLHNRFILDKLCACHFSLQRNDVILLRPGIQRHVLCSSQPRREFSGPPDYDTVSHDRKNAEMYWRLKRFDKAITILQEVVEWSPEYMPMSLLLHDCYLNTGQTDKAHALRQQMRRQPGAVGAQDDWEMLVILEVCAAEAKQDHEEVVSIARSHIPQAELLQRERLLTYLHGRIDDALPKLGRHDEAAEAVGKAEFDEDTKNPRFVLAFKGKPIAFEGFDSVDHMERLAAHSIQRCREDENTDPTLLQYFHMMHSFALRKQGKEEEALSAMREAQILDPWDVRVYAELSDILSSLNRHEEALEAQEKVVELEPDDKRHHMILASRLQKVLKEKMEE